MLGEERCQARPQQGRGDDVERTGLPLLPPVEEMPGLARQVDEARRIDVLDVPEVLGEHYVVNGPVARVPGTPAW
jgi:hypothetical protein